MKLSLGPRTPARLCDSLQHKLTTYRLAAIAAAVGALVPAQPAEAKIVYRKADSIIGPDGYWPFSLINGQTDLIFSAAFTYESGFSNGVLAVNPRSSGNFLGHADSKGVWNAAALPAGYSISGHDKSNSFNKNNPTGFMAGFVCVVGKTCSSGGAWWKAKNHYLGVQFRSKGKLHFGWARLSVKCKKTFGCTGHLTGFAYETIPNKAIIAGKTKGPDVVTLSDTLGGLAKGAAFHPKQVSLPKQH